MRKDRTRGLNNLMLPALKNRQEGQYRSACQIHVASGLSVRFGKMVKPRKIELLLEGSIGGCSVRY